MNRTFIERMSKIGDIMGDLYIELVCLEEYHRKETQMATKKKTAVKKTAKKSKKSVK